MPEGHKYEHEKIQEKLQNLDIGISNNRAEIKYVDEKSQERYRELLQETRDLKDYRIANEIKFENLLDKMNGVLSKLNWLIALFFGSLLAFFIWYIQKL